jgi:hypothetical protein
MCQIHFLGEITHIRHPSMIDGAAMDVKKGGRDGFSLYARGVRPLIRRGKILRA